jgi:hypothetical protein
MKMLNALLLVVVLGCGGKKPAPAPPPANPEPATAGVECAKEIALECPEGQIDGCLKTPVEGTTHACVAK